MSPRCACLRLCLGRITPPAALVPAVAAAVIVIAIPSTMMPFCPEIGFCTHTYEIVTGHPLNHRTAERSGTTHGSEALGCSASKATCRGRTPVAVHRINRRFRRRAAARRGNIGSALRAPWRRPGRSSACLHHWRRGPGRRRSHRRSDQWRVVAQSYVRPGWTVGAGIEYAIDRSWSAKLEYLHVDLNDTPYLNDLNPAVNGVNRGDGVPLSEEIIRVGVNYKF
jgi:opacity protein-like surface antigen